MALVMSAAGIHAAASVTPDETLGALLDSLSTELTETEMYFSVFYGVLDPLTGRLAYANAGHPYAFRVPRFGEPERLETTAPPLGLATAGSIQRRQVPWSVGHDLLVPVDRWPGGRAERVGRGVRRGAPAGRGLLEADRAGRGDREGGARGRRCVRRATGGRSHAAGPEDLSVPRAKRRLGQHFLTDPRILGRIADALEAGPDGHGARDRSRDPAGSPRRSRRAAGRLVAIEKDARPRAGAPGAVPGGGDRRGRRARAGLAGARGAARRWSPATFPTTSRHRCSTRRSSRRGPPGSSSWCRRKSPTASRRRRGAVNTVRSPSACGPWRRRSGSSRSRPARSSRDPRWTRRCSG